MLTKRNVLISFGVFVFSSLVFLSISQDITFVERLHKYSAYFSVFLISFLLMYKDLAFPWNIAAFFIPIVFVFLTQTLPGNPCNKYAPDEWCENTKSLQIPECSNFSCDTTSLSLFRSFYPQCDDQDFINEISKCDFFKDSLIILPLLAVFGFVLSMIHLWLNSSSLQTGFFLTF